MVYENNYNQRTFSKIFLLVGMAIFSILLSIFISSIGFYKNDKNGSTIFLLFVGLVILILLSMVYYVAMYIYDKTNIKTLSTKVISKQIKLLAKTKSPYIFIFGENQFSLKFENLKTDIGVTREIYNALDEGNSVEITYYPLSKTLVNVKAL